MRHVDWKALAIDKLQTYPARAAAVESLPDDIRALDAKMTAPKGGAVDAMPVRDGGNHYEDRLITDIALKDEMTRALEKARGDVCRVEQALAHLTDEQRLILDHFYMHRTRDYIDRLCEELGYERAQVYRMKDDALYMFTLYLYGAIEL